MTVPPVFFRAAPNQIRHWRHSRANPQSPALNITVALMLEGPIDRGALRRATADMLHHHDVFKWRPFEADGELFWQPAPPLLPGIEAVTVIEPHGTENVLAALRAEAARPFALETEPLARFTLMPADRDAWIVLLNVHHIALDGWSVELLTRELVARYRALTEGTALTLPASQPYHGFASYQHAYVGTSAGDADWDYWQQELTGARHGLGFPTQEVGRNTGWPRGRMIWAWLPHDLTRAVRAAARAAAVTPFALLLTAFGRVLGRATAARDLIVGVPFFNRLRPEDKDLVGFVVNTAPMRLMGLDDPDDRSVIRRVADCARRGFAHQRLPYYELLKRLGPEFESGAQPLFRSMFIMHGNQTAGAANAGPKRSQAWVSTGGAKYNQTWSVEEHAGTFTLDVEWNPALFTESRVRAWMEEYATELAGLAGWPLSATEPSRATALEWPVLDTLRSHFVGPVILDAHEGTAVSTLAVVGESGAVDSRP